MKPITNPHPPAAPQPARETTSHGHRKRKALEVLRELGPMTRLELQEQTGIPPSSMGQLISSLHRPCARFGKRVHIVRWVRSIEGTRDYLRPVYAYGDGKDAPKPRKVSRTESNRRYRERMHARYTSSSVFRLAASQTQAVQALGSRS
jgi:hypothetical protein